MTADIGPQIEWIKRLCAFDTTSRNSNLPLIQDVQDYLAELGVSSTRVLNAEGTKANLYASVGPMTEGGVILSGHTDVVPVDGQPWRTDPWRVEETDGRLYGRGVADMKSFSAIALSLVPDMLAADLKRPIHFALSYDEEVGCLGAPSMIAEMRDKLPAPLAVIVGEPTEMKVVDSHKGVAINRTTIIGFEAHSSQHHLGASAIMAAGELITKIAEMTRQRANAAITDKLSAPAHTTMTVGLIQGGTAANILARECVFDWDVRITPEDSLEHILAEFNQAAAGVEKQMRLVSDECSVTTETIAHAPPLRPQADNAAVSLAHALTGSNKRHVVAYGAEAGQFQEAGFQTVICGPGSIEQAHQPNEFIELSQVGAGAEFIRKLIIHLSA